jgi:hypothetical protein
VENSVTVHLHDGAMTESDNFSAEFSMDCKTCIGAATTACSDCIVTHLLANDDGPIDYVPVALAESFKEVPRVPDANEIAISLFQRAGLVDDPVHLVAVDDFDAYGVPARV